MSLFVTPAEPTPGGPIPARDPTPQAPRRRIPSASGSTGTVVAHNGAAIFGGAERWTVRLLGRLQDRGHRVLLLCRDPAMRERIVAHGVPAEVAHLGGHVSLHDAVAFALRLRRLRPDGLLLSTFKKTWLGGLGARLAGVPRVVARIGLSTDLPGRRAVYRVAFGRWVDRVVVNADGLRAPVLAGIPGGSPEKVVTGATGPKISSRSRSASCGTSVSTVGE